MINVRLPHTAPGAGEQGRRLVFYLALEEFVAARLVELTGGLTASRAPLEAFFLWQVPPTVIFGRNQVMEAEVNLPYCREQGIATFRRKSGGGCVYADRGNVMCSCITEGKEADKQFDRYLRRMTEALRRLGLDAELSGRNDILVRGRKVSGNAFFYGRDTSIVHGTMLFETDFVQLERAITPSVAKIRSKGVNSVRQRVTNVREELAAAGRDMDIEAFKRYLIGELCTGEVVLTEADIAEVEAIEATYLDPAFLEGRNHRWTVERSGKVEGAGEFCVTFEKTGEEITAVSVTGDYFSLEEADGPDFSARLTGWLSGVEDRKDAVEKALEGIDLTRFVRGLKTADLVRLLYDKP